MARKIIGKADAKGERNKYLVNAVSPARLSFTNGVGIVDGQHFQIYVMHRFREEQPVGWGAPFLGSKDLPTAVSIVVEPASEKLLEEQTNRSAALSQYAEIAGSRSVVDEIKLQQEKEHALRIANLVTRDNVKMVNATIYITLRSPEKEGVLQGKAYLERLLEPTGNDIREIKGNMDKSFWGASPLMCPDEVAFQQAATPMPATTLAWMLPFTKAGMADATGVPIGTDQAGGLVRFNTINHTHGRMNGNGFVVGMSGCGKSTLLKHIVLREWMLWRTKTLWLDPEGEAVDFVKTLGFNVVTIGDTQGAFLSPFEPRNIGAIGDDEMPAGTHSTGQERREAALQAAQELVLAATIPFLKTYLQTAFAIDEEAMDYLEIAIEDIYWECGIGIDTTFAQFYAGDGRYPSMRDLYGRLEELAGAAGVPEEDRQVFRRLALKLRSAAVGANRALFEGRTRIDADADIVLINTRNISNDKAMKTAQYYNILSWCWSQIRAQRYTGRYVRIISDELHSIVNRENLAASMMVKDIVQRCRKYGAGFIGVTPQIADFRAEEIKDIGGAIMQNATYRFFGQSSGDNLDAIAELEGLSPEVKDALKEADKGKFIACAGGRDKTWVNVEIPAWELDLFGAGGGK